MKRQNTFLAFGILLLCMGILFSSCKKKESTPTPISPAFIVTATTVQLQGGGNGLQFYAKCTNTDVKMTKVTINDPLGANTITYNLNGTYEVSNEIFMLEDATTAYTDEIGTWTFNFVGNLTSDGTAFASNASLVVSGK
jgi:hypothetical protein